MKKDQFGDLVVTIKKILFCGKCNHDITNEKKEIIEKIVILDGKEFIVNGKPHKYIDKSWIMCPNCGSKNKIHDARWFYH